MSVPIDILIDRYQDRTTVLIIKNKKIEQAYCSPFLDSEAAEPTYGAVFEAKCTQLFLDTSSAIFTPLTQTASQKTYFCKKKEKGIKTGDIRTVQLQKHFLPFERKESNVSMPPVFKGRYLVYLPFEKGIHISKKWATVQNVEEIRSTLKSISPNGWILRSSSENLKFPADMALIIAEANHLIALSQDKDFKGYHPLELALQDYGHHKKLSITSATELDKQVRSIISGFCPDLAQCIKAPSPHPLSDLDYDSQLDKALEYQSIQYDFGSLHCHQVPHGPFFIDIDCKLTSLHNMDNLMRQVGIEIMRLIRVLNLSGILLIDFLRLPLSYQRQKLHQDMRLLGETDPASPQILGFTKAGYFEIIRDHQTPSLPSILGSKP